MEVVTVLSDRTRFRRDAVRSARRLGQRADQGPCPHRAPGELPCSLECFAGGDRHADA
jgi:hypothetical protein